MLAGYIGCRSSEVADFDVLFFCFGVCEGALSCSLACSRRVPFLLLPPWRSLNEPGLLVFFMICDY